MFDVTSQIKAPSFLADLGLEAGAIETVGETVSAAPISKARTFTQQDLENLLRRKQARGTGAHHERSSYASLLDSRRSALVTGMKAAPSSSSAIATSAPSRIQLRSTHKAAWSS